LTGHKGPANPYLQFAHGPTIRLDGSGDNVSWFDLLNFSHALAAGFHTDSLASAQSSTADCPPRDQRKEPENVDI
jgi:hypothetical protein